MLRTIVMIVVVVLLLSFFGISIRGIIESPAGQENFAFMWGLIQQGWAAIVSSWHDFTAFLASAFHPLRFPQ